MSYFFSKKDSRGLNASTPYLNACKPTKRVDVRMLIAINGKLQKAVTVW